MAPGDFVAAVNSPRGARERLIDIPVGAMRIIRSTLFFLTFMQRFLVRASEKKK